MKFLKMRAVNYCSHNGIDLKKCKMLTFFPTLKFHHDTFFQDLLPVAEIPSSPFAIMKSICMRLHVQTSEKDMVILAKL